MSEAPDNPFDDFTPPEPIEFRKRPVAQTREMPASEEAEQHVIACAMLDGAEKDSAGKLDHESLRRAARELTADSFYWPANQVLFQTMLDLADAGRPCSVEVVAEELKNRKQLNAVGGFAYLMQVTGKIPTTAHAGYFIEKVRELHVRRELIKKAMEAVEKAYSFADGSLDQLLSDVRAGIDSAAKLNEVDVSAKSLVDFTVPRDDDSSVLLGTNRYLCRGGAALMVSSSGMGKSSFSIQAAVMWALGRPFLGIKPNGNLKSLIIQAEDDDGDIGEVWESIRQGLDLTDIEVAEVKKRVVIVSERVRRGERFLAALRGLVRKHKPDLVWINPLLAFMDGDLTEAKDAGKFLREGLNATNDGSFAYIVVHHTNKPPSAKDRGDRKWNEVMYDGAGSAELTNWARAIIIIKATENEGEFNIVLAKRGKRAGVVQEVGEGLEKRFEVTTIIPAKHSTGTITLPGRPRPMPMILWEVRIVPIETKADEPEEDAPKRSEKYVLGDILSSWPPYGSEPWTLKTILSEVVGGGRCTKAQFQEARTAALKAGYIQLKDGGETRTEAGDNLVHDFLKGIP